MGNPILLFGTVIGVALVGLVATILVGLSRENREGNPQYDRNSKPNWLRLTAIYGVTTILALVALVWFIRG